MCTSDRYVMYDCFQSYGYPCSDVATESSIDFTSDDCNETTTSSMITSFENYSKDRQTPIDGKGNVSKKRTAAEMENSCNRQ